MTTGDELFDQLRVEHPRVGETWGYVEVGDVVVDVCERRERFVPWHAYRFPKGVIVGIGFEASYESAWRAACVAIADP